MSHADADRTGLLGRFCDWLKARLAYDQELAMLAQLDLDHMAADIGVSRADLEQILPRDAEDGLLMDRMMRARGLDPTWIREVSGPLLRDLELTCAHCDATRRCRRELSAGTAAANAHGFCRNATTFDAILGT
ncbi:MAG: hypothetical protein J0H67_16950 [Rhodospirillales bacterium]|nr:hypothetical protein [Rhodospirillales bacterium]